MVSGTDSINSLELSHPLIHFGLRRWGSEDTKIPSIFMNGRTILVDVSKSELVWSVSVDCLWYILL